MIRKIPLLCVFVVKLTFAQQVAVTFDDLPFGYSSGYTAEEKIEAMDNILASLKAHDIKATMLITTGNLDADTEIILDRVKAAGHQLGNHSHRHFNFNAVSSEEYIADIEQCKEIAGGWFNSAYFRYPMLRRGNTAAKRDAVYRYLDEAGYIIAPVSIDNNEWIYNRDFSRAKKRGSQMEMDSIASAYLRHMKDISLSYDAKATKLTGRSIKHILLLHANPINGQYLNELLDWYVSAGWEFISLDEAMADPIYAIKDTLISEIGMSQIDKLEKLRSQD